MIKNIIATDTILMRTNNNVLETSLKKLEIFDETIGSIITPTILYINNKAAIFITGNIVIIVNKNNPIIPTPFFSIVDEPITVSTASDKNPPTIGTNVSTANFAVLIEIPSILLESPYIVIIPTNIVKEAVIINTITCRPNSDNFLNSLQSDRLDKILIIKVKYIKDRKSVV